MAKKRKKKAVKKPIRIYNTNGLARYRAITTAIREYYKEGKAPKDRREIREIYHKIKDKLKDVPIGQVRSSVDGILEARDIAKFPPELLAFTWYHFEDLLSKNTAYFNASDEIILDLSIIKKDTFEFDYKNLEGQYRKAYQVIRPDIDRILRYPEFQYVGMKDKVYTWQLTGEEKAGTSEAGEEAPEKGPTGGGKAVSEEIELEKEKQKTIEKKKELTQARTKLTQAKAELSKARSIEIAQLKDLYKEGLITKAQFQKRFNKLN